MKPLTMKQERFCIEYVKESNATQAYRASYNCGNMKPETVNRRASEVLNGRLVAARIEELRKKISERLEYTVQDVVMHWLKIATADPNEIIQHRRNCCRHCYGIGHARQWNEMEYALICAKAIQQKKLKPGQEELPGTPLGGFGFDASREPYPHCPLCHGEGVASVFVADTRKLKGSARLLYAGLKKTRDGLEMKFRDQDDAMRNVAKFLGMFKDKPPASGEPAVLTPISAVTKDPVEATKIYQRVMSGD